MAISIRLKREGKRNSPFYRIIVADKRDKNTGKFIELLGYYNPILRNEVFSANKERIRYWLKEGAEVSETVKTLLKKFGIWGSILQDEKTKLTG